MITDISKKLEFILTWYNKERVMFNFVSQIMLAKAWISICTKNEEYEMASALQKEKDRIIKEYLNTKRANRKLRQKILYCWIKLKRKLLYL